MCAPPRSSRRSRACAPHCPEWRSPIRRRMIPPWQPRRPGWPTSPSSIVGYTADDEGEYIGSEAFADPAAARPLPTARRQSRHAAAPGGSLEWRRGIDAMAASGGAGGDRLSLRLRPVDADIIRAVAAANARTVVAIITAGAVITEEWRACRARRAPELVLRVRGRPCPGRCAARSASTRPDGCPSRSRSSEDASPVLRPRRHRHHLRQVVRATPARPGRPRRRVPARVRLVLHGLCALRPLRRRPRGRRLRGRRHA